MMRILLVASVAALGCALTLAVVPVVAAGEARDIG